MTIDLSERPLHEARRRVDPGSAFLARVARPVNPNRVSSLLLLASLALVSTHANGQSATYSFFGADCTSTIWPGTVFNNVGLPKLGSTYFVETHSSSGGIGGNVDAYVITGASRTTWAGFALPLDTSVFTSVGIGFCGNLYASIDVLTKVPYRGIAPVLERVPFAVPASTALLGARVFQQVFQNVRSPNHNDWFFTKGAEAVLGN